MANSIVANSRITRREFLSQTASFVTTSVVAQQLLSKMAHASALSAAEVTPQNADKSNTKPNVLVLFTDEQRWDSLGVNGSPMNLTPNADRLAREGVLFSHACTNQPLCGPARGCLWTGLYATTHGVWRNNETLRPVQTIAHILGNAGYETGYIGKWHLAPKGNGSAAVAPQYRAGFDGFWEAAQAIETTSEPYNAVLWDADGQEIRIPGYRVDALTSRAINFLDQPRNKPFFLAVSYLEPHQQNTMKRFVAPDGYAQRYANPYVPEDLRPFSGGNWAKELPDYYGMIARIDECVGQMIDVLTKRGQLENTIIVFVSDHGCHFKTRNGEYKRSPHDASIRIPMIMRGPGFRGGRVLPQRVGIVDVTPTLLDAVGLPVPAIMQGRSMLPLVSSTASDWQDEVFVQISETMTGRAIRSARWTYCISTPKTNMAQSNTYVEANLYDNEADPHQLTNLVGNPMYRQVADDLLERLLARMAAVGETRPNVKKL